MAVLIRLVLVLSGLLMTFPAAAATTRTWAGHIAEASARFGIPEAWIHRVMRAESGGRTHRYGRPIRSHAGAMGLMQIMPATWQAMRIAHDLGVDPDDPRDNILAGTAYLKAMHDRFGYPGLFAAYNAGPTRYARYLARGGRLPAETVAYIAKVTGAETSPWISRTAPALTPSGPRGPLFPRWSEPLPSGMRADPHGQVIDGRPGIFFTLRNGPRH